MSATLTPVIAVHLTTALGAFVLGPVALWTRLGQTVRPNWHRWAGRTWALLMLVAALSAVGVRNSHLALWQGFSLIHLFIPVVFIGVSAAFAAIRRGNVRLHRRIMQNLYFFALIVPGVFTLLPSRYLGQLVWHHGLGWL